MDSPRWIQKLKKRWNLQSTGQVLIVLLVFALTGTTVLLIKRPLFGYWFPEGEKPLWASIAYYILILPVYNLLLLFYGLLLGQFRFFWDFEKKFFKRIFAKFK